jgi:glycosyltransferase involved in cell wall biosynthesis
MTRLSEKVLLVANWDWVMYNFRMPLARALRDRGYDVALVFPFGRFLDRVRQEGFRCVHWPLDRGSTNALRDARALWALARIYGRERPRLVHHFTVKPNLYGTLAARAPLLRCGPAADRPAVINTFTGLGFLFSDHGRARALRRALSPLLRYALHRPGVWTVFHDRADLGLFVRRRLVPASRAAVVPGSGVDAQRFFPNGSGDHLPAAPVTVVMACRMLWDKGVGELVEAARALRQKGLPVRFWLAGSTDPANPACIPGSVLRTWQEERVVEWVGHRDDIPDLLRQAHVAVLPSHHEAVPRFLLEAAASGLPLVATDIPGCREVVRHGENGFLVPVRDPRALAEAIEALARDAAMRRRMGLASRALATREFDERRVVEAWLALYEGLLRTRPEAGA